MATQQEANQYLRTRGIPPTGGNGSRVLAANMRDDSVLSPGETALLAELGRHTDNLGSGGPGVRGGGTRGGALGGQTVVGRGAPSGGSSARDIERGAQTGYTQPGQARSDTAAGGGPRAQASSDTAARVGGNAGAQSTRDENTGIDWQAVLGMLAGGAAAVGGPRGEFVGNIPPGASGRMMDVPPESLLPGPRAGGIGGPSATAMQGMLPGVPVPRLPGDASDPFQMAMERAIGGPRADIGAPQLPAPGPRPPIPMPDQTSGPTIARPDQRPIPPGAGVPPGEVAPTTVNRTTGPGTNPNAIVNPPVDASRARSILEALIGSRVGNRGGSVRTPAPMRFP